MFSDARHSESLRLQHATSPQLRGEMSPKNSERAIRPRSQSKTQDAENISGKPTKNASSACSACKKRKSRCVGGVPCAPCLRAKTECGIDFDNDGRRRVSFKRKIESLEQDRDLLMQLMDTIRSDDNRTAPGVLNLIRSNASVNEIRHFLDSSSTTSGSSDDASKKLQRKESRKYMDIKRLSDIPLFEVPAKPWTTVTDDSSFVSHLISLYFTWQHPVLNWIDRDLFIRDMQSGDLKSKFCSPLLVNSILAVACFYSWYPEVFAVAEEPSSRGEHFFKEAVRLLGEEEGRLSLTNLQARGDIYTCACVMGKDRLGWQYLVEIAECARYFINRLDNYTKKSDKEAQEMSKSVNIALHGLFSLNPVATLSLQKPSVIKRPRLQYFPQDHHKKDDWTPYPRQAESQLAHTYCVSNAVYDFASITWQVSDYLFGDEKPAIPDSVKIEGFYERLKTWHASIPDCISQKSNATVGSMEMHMRYHNAVLIMFGFIQAGTEESSTSDKDRIQKIRVSSALEISDILNQFRSLWPVEYMPMNSMQYATMALFTLLDHLEGEKERKAFSDTLISLRALARRWQLAKGMLRLIQLTAVKQAVDLPAEAGVLLRDFEEQLWTANDRQRFSSLYPNYAVSTNYKEGATDEAELDRLLDEWDSLTLSKEADTGVDAGGDAGNNQEENSDPQD